MECFLCNCTIVINLPITSGVKCGVEKSDGCIYCLECADVIDFALDISNKKVIEKPTQLKPELKASSVVYFYCSTCEKHVSGTKCEECSNPNPLFNRKTKKKKKQKNKL